MSVKHVGITNKNERGKSVRETNKISSKKRVGVYNGNFVKKWVFEH